MGGSAFASGDDPLDTPRMPAAVYHRKKAQFHAVLGELFVCVASPLDGPAKTDFGDVDITVCLGRATGSGHVLDDIALALGATRDIRHSDTRATLAVPWPCSDDDPSPASGAVRPRHVQVDVAVCRTLPQFHFGLFRHAHGDFWAIVGSMIRPAGLTLDDTALCLRVAAMERENFKKSKILLTAEPTEILHFLGLADGRHWEEPFPTVQDMFELAATELSAGDKRRTSTRPVYHQWVTEFLPQYRDRRRSVLPAGGAEGLAAQVRQQAFARFPGVRAAHDARLREFLREKRTHEGKRLIKSAVPTAHADGRPVGANLRGCALSALRRIIFEHDGSYGLDVAAVAATVTDADGLYDMERLAAFVRLHWQDVGRKHANMQQDGLKGGKKRPAGHVADA
ncbi:hypothetical protein P8C59_003309 [Phyllachora maydis]|uniref:Uncharacterized protein n=1 Tax=Phyllachora maydis TaxID=1825666 RepID=A0AAD9I165_9PEZI|nr:hypothetical protein P8C59_003309 [Phyllachora maydis]